VTLREISDYPNIVVLQMVIPASRWADGAWVDAERRRLVQEVLEGPLGRSFENPVQWFYDPMAVTAFLGHMDESAVVYDCMDELSQFKGAPAELVRRERELLNAADVVFAGGPKMAKSKRVSIRTATPTAAVSTLSTSAKHGARRRKCRKMWRSSPGRCLATSASSMSASITISSRSWRITIPPGASRLSARTRKSIPRISRNATIFTSSAAAITRACRRTRGIRRLHDAVREK
jgi:hypothetical protein